MASPGKNNKAKTWEELGIPPEEIARLTIQIYEQRLESIKGHLVKATVALNKALGRNDKVKGNVVDLAASVSSMADIVSGFLGYNQDKRNQVLGILSDFTAIREDASGRFEVVEDDDGRKTNKPIVACTYSGKASKIPRDDIEAALIARFKIQLYEAVYGTMDKPKEKNNG
jgi:hypothetical protein